MSGVRQPVPFRVQIVAASTVFLFAAVLGWGHAERQQLAAEVARSPVGESGGQPELAERPAPEVERIGTSVARGGESVARLREARRAALPEREQVQATAGTLGESFMWPVAAPISSVFGMRDGRMHRGIDLAADHGDPILAALDGKVYFVGDIRGYGNTVILEHPNGIRTLYAHCSVLLVKQGQQVRRGELIARVGSTGFSTGPHLHFEILVNERHQDPLAYLPRRQGR